MKNTVESNAERANVIFVLRQRVLWHERRAHRTVGHCEVI
jgi:hypothetical protein